MEFLKVAAIAQLNVICCVHGVVAEEVVEFACFIVADVVLTDVIVCGWKLCYQIDF